MNGSSAIAEATNAKRRSASLRRRMRRDRSHAEHMALLARVSQRIAARLDPDELFATTCAELHIRLGYQHSAIFLLDPQRPDVLIKRASASRWPGNPNGHRQPIDRGLMGAAVRERAAILANDVATDPRYVPVRGAPEIRAELATPIVLGDRLLGILDVASTRSLDGDDLSALRLVADQLAVAILNARLLGDTQRALDTTCRLYDASRRISTAMTVDDVVAVFMDEVAARSPYSCLLLLDTGEGKDGELAVAGSFCPRRGSLGQLPPFPQLGAEIGELLDAGQTVWLADVLDDARAGTAELQLAAHLHARSLGIIPLVCGARIGMVAVGGPEPQVALGALEPYEAIAPQLAAAIDSRRQHVLHAERERQLAVLEERRRLARELHDSVTQSLFGLNLLSQAVPELLKSDPQAAAESLASIHDLAGGALGEMRALLYELRPDEERRVALPGALRDVIGVFERRSGLRVVAEIGTVIEPPGGVAHAFVRIAQEALGNAARHSVAQRVEVRLSSFPLRLSIADDGRGFVPGSGGGLGLLGMHERASAIGARLSIDSAPGHGTRISVEWPGDLPKDINHG